jgi:hypothetical protein
VGGSHVRLDDVRYWHDLDGFTLQLDHPAAADGRR